MRSEGLHEGSQQRDPDDSKIEGNLKDVAWSCRLVKRARLQHSPAEFPDPCQECVTKSAKCYGAKCSGR